GARRNGQPPRNVHEALARGMAALRSSRGRQVADISQGATPHTGGMFLRSPSWANPSDKNKATTNGRACSWWRMGVIMDCKSLCHESERELRADLAGERARHDHTSRSDESVRLAEVRALHIVDEVVAEVGAIGQVESLEDQLQARLVAELDVLADSQ